MYSFFDFFSKTTKLLILVLVLLCVLPFIDEANATTPSGNRISGVDRFDTAVKTSKAGWASGAETAIIARGDLYPDALAGAPLASKLNAPILLSESDRLNPRTKIELARLKVKKVILLGGTFALSSTVEKEIKKLGITTDRIAGSGRYDTALKIAKSLNPTKDEAFIATGLNFPDALAIAPYAAEKGIPILLTEPTKTSNSILGYLKSFKQVSLIGGEAAISPSIEKRFANVNRISGKDRYDTASNIIKTLYDNNEKLYISTGENFPDALTGSVLAAKNHTGILLTAKTKVPASSELVFPQQHVTSYQVFGGEAAVSNEVLTQMNKLLATFKDAVGGGDVTSKARVLSENDMKTLNSNTKDFQVEDNGTITYILSNPNKFYYKKDDILFLPPDESHPTGMIAEVISAEKKNGNLNLSIGQPAIDKVFEDININIDQLLNASQLVDMDLEDGVTLDVGDQQVHSIQELNRFEGSKFLASNNLKIGFNLDLLDYFKQNDDESVSDDGMGYGNLEKELTLSGSAQIGNIKPKAKIKRSLFAKKWKSFDFGVTFDSTIKADLDGNLKGDFGLQNNTDYNIGNDWVGLEGVDRSDRISLASFTFVPGPIVVQGAGLGDVGYKEVPVGITLFITTTLKGDFDVSMHIGYIKQDTIKSGIKWNSDSNDFDPYKNITTDKHEFSAGINGEIDLINKYGADAALNVGGLLPAVVENDFVIHDNATGDADFKVDMKNGNDIEVDGCFKNELEMNLQSVAKYRLMAKLWKVESGIEGELNIGNPLTLYKNTKEACVNSGTLEGVATDAVTEDPISDVKISILKDGHTIKTVDTDDNGKYSLQLRNNNYDIKYEKDGYKTLFYENVEIDSNNVTYNPEMKLLSYEYTHEPGIVGGLVSNAQNGVDIEGVTLNLRSGYNSRTGEILKTVQTNSSGKYYIENLAAGYYTAELIKNGFNTTFINIISIGGQEKLDQHAALRPNIPDDVVSVVLTWGNTPSDLDSHLTGPLMDSNERFHIYYGDDNYSFNGNLVAQLDHDDTSSFGPETVTILKRTPGVYRYYVHDYTNSNDSESLALSNSNAKVEVYFGNNLVRTFNVPENKKGIVWSVFELSGSIITPINQIASDENQMQSVGSANFGPNIEKLILPSFLEKK